MFSRVIELVMSGRERRALVLSLSLAIPVVVCALSASMRDRMSTTSAALVLVLCVVVAGTSGQRIAALLAAVSSGISFDYFLTRPYYSLVISDPDDVEVTVLLIFIGVIVTEATMWGLRQESRAARRSGYLDGALRAAGIAHSGTCPPPPSSGSPRHRSPRSWASRPAASSRDQYTTPDSPCCTTTGE